MKKNTHRLYAELSATIKTAAEVREELKSGRLSRLGRPRRHPRYALLVFHARCIVEQIRGAAIR
jgi:hypothetical protein